jgi:hypothetical protein
MGLGRVWPDDERERLSLVLRRKVAGFHFAAPSYGRVTHSHGFLVETCEEPVDSCVPRSFPIPGQYRFGHFEVEIFNG